jgi:23S rRNA (adenine2503-C2)-methyltransferase
MRRFADEGIPVTLSVSLHAPDDETRKKAHAVASAYSIDEILDACRTYIEKTGRRVIFEYALAGGVQLRSAARGPSREEAARDAVPRQPDPAQPRGRERARAPPAGAVEAFLARLAERHIPPPAAGDGDDIEGACGQLRGAFLETKEVKPS